MAFKGFLFPCTGLSVFDPLNSALPLIPENFKLSLFEMGLDSCSSQEVLCMHLSCCMHLLGLNSGCRVFHETCHEETIRVRERPLQATGKNPQPTFRRDGAFQAWHFPRLKRQCLQKRLWTLF